MLRHAQPDDLYSTGPRVSWAVSVGSFITAPGSTIQDFLTKPRGAFVWVPGGPIALHTRKCLGDKVRHMPSLLLVGVLGNDPKWRVTSASHLYAQYIICASLAVGMIYMPLFMP